MQDQLYVKLEAGERIREGDVYFDKKYGDWVGIASLEVKPIAGTGWIRPVSTDTSTLPTEEVEEEFRHGLRPVYAGLNEFQRMKSLREHYAGLAMQGLISNPNATDDGWAHAYASVKLADALIAALNKKEESA